MKMPLFIARLIASFANTSGLRQCLLQCFINSCVQCTALLCKTSTSILHDPTVYFPFACVAEKFCTLHKILKKTTNTTSGKALALLISRKILDRIGTGRPDINSTKKDCLLTSQNNNNNNNQKCISVETEYRAFPPVIIVNIFNLMGRTRLQ